MGPALSTAQMMKGGTVPLAISPAAQCPTFHATPCISVDQWVSC